MSLHLEELKGLQRRDVRDLPSRDEFKVHTGEELKIPPTTKIGDTALSSEITITQEE